MRAVLRTELQHGVGPSAALTVAVAMAGGMLAHQRDWVGDWAGWSYWMRAVLILVGPAVVAAAAWQGGRNRRRGLVELHESVPRPRLARAVVAWSGPAAWSLAAYVVVVSFLPTDLPSAGGLIAAFALAWGLGGYRDRRVHLALLPAIALVAWLPGRDLGTTAYALVAGALFVLTARTSLWMLDIVVQLDRGRTAQAALAVAEERLRFSRDVHDVLGRRLSAIAVQLVADSVLAFIAGEG